jgi:hypothetical protein
MNRLAPIQVGEYPGVETNVREKGGDHKTPGVEEEATGCENTSERNWGTLQLLDLKGTREGERAGQRAEAASESCFLLCTIDA